MSIKSGLSLQHIMNEMAACPQGMLADDSMMPNGPTGGAGAYMDSDPLLADLYKQYINAQQIYRHLCKISPRRDPMTATARNLYESARRSFQVRLRELKSRNNLCRHALSSLRQGRKMDLFYASEKNRRERAAQARRRSEESYFIMWFLFMMLQQAVWRARADLHAVQAFTLAAKAQDVGYAAA